MKLKGGTLFYALSLSVIIGLIMSAVILNEYYLRSMVRHDMICEDVIRNAESGIFYACAFHSDDETQEVDLFGRGKDSVSLQRKAWGAYDVCVAKAHTGNQYAERVAMLGVVNDATNKFALWLADMDRPLAITGNTLLRGTCYLPKSGIERAYIEGNSFSGKQMVEGETKVSSRFLPPTDVNRAKALANLCNYQTADEDTLVSWEDAGEEIARSFSIAPMIIKESVPIRIHQHISGQVIIISSVSIDVLKSSNLENVILLAPKIRIENEVHGQFQVFASDSILCGNDVLLEYPSVLAIYRNDDTPNASAILVGESAKLNGEIFIATHDEDIRNTSSVCIAPQAEIQGSIYCSGTVDLKGSVFGSVCCTKFSLKTNSATYENHLMDATIDAEARNESWIGSMLTGNHESSWNIVQWLN